MRASHAFMIVCVLSMPGSAMACSATASSTAAANSVSGEAKSKIDQLRNRIAAAKSPSAPSQSGQEASLPEKMATHPLTEQAVSATPAVAKQIVSNSGAGIMEGVATAGEKAATGVAGTVTRIGGPIIDAAKGMLNPDVAIGVREISNAAKEKNVNRGAGLPMSNARRNQLEQAMRD